MTNLCTIGPLSLELAHLYDGNTFNYSAGTSVETAYGASVFQKGQYGSEEEFSVICNSDEAIQLKGLLEIGEPIWIDTNNELTDNDYLQHKGWYILNEMDIEFINDLVLQANIKAFKISQNESEILSMDYTKGYYSGAKLNVDFNPTVTTYQLQDAMTSFSATHWDTTTRGYNAGTKTCASDGAELDFTIASAADGQHACAWVTSKKKYYPPFTVETVLDRNTLPGSGSYNASIALGLSKDVMRDGDSQGLWKTTYDWFYAQWAVANGSTSFELASNPTGAGWTQMYPWTSQGTTFAELGVRLSVDTNGNLTAWTDLDTTGTWTQIYSGPIKIDVSQGLYLYLHVYNQDSTSWTGSFQYCNVYNDDEIAYPNLQLLPAGLTNDLSGGSDEFDGAEGTSPYYYGDEDLYFIADPDHLYDNSVKLYCANNDTDTSGQVFSTDYVLDGVSTILQNAFTKLEVLNDTDLKLYGWYEGQWNHINTFVPSGGIYLIKPLVITPDKVVIQVNDTRIQMLRSSPMLTLWQGLNDYHSYTLRNAFYYDGALDTSIISGDAIPTTDDDTGYYPYTYDIIDNLNTANVATGTDTGGVTTGFTAVASATLSSSTTYAYNGTKSLKTVTPNAVAGEGFKVTVTGLTIGQTYTARAYVKGTAAVVLKYRLLGTGLYTTTTLTGGWDMITISGVATSTSHDFEILTNAKVSTTFYADEFVLIKASSIPSSVMNMTTGDLHSNNVLLFGAAEYGMINADSFTLLQQDIPLGIGWTTQTGIITTNDYILYPQLQVQNWWMQGKTGISIKQVV